MAVITFASSRKATGKTTCAILLATALAARGRFVTLVDGDPQQSLTVWHRQAGAKASGLALATLPGAAGLSSLAREGRRARHDVVIDLSTDRNAFLACALGVADHVVVPMPAEHLEGGGEPVLALLAAMQSRSAVRLTHSVLLSRLNPLVPASLLAALRRALAERGVPVLETPVVERAAFAAMLQRGRMLETELEGTVRPGQAIANAACVATDLLKLLPGEIPAGTRTAA
ncbi:AAA family ATPase [Ensifer soli]|uniref:AAA family ATPase n=1 Tax=Ciceribacter sp. sgz301302 TaxID=3342379 RepID=UPI0035B81533